MKFKVGDRVRAIYTVDGINLAEKCGTVIACPNNGYYDMCVEFDEAFVGGHCGPKRSCRWGYESEFEFETAAAIKKDKPTKHPKIVITTDGKETLARMYDESGKVVRSATASCHPDDSFVFEIGARIAFDRLVGEEGKPEVEEEEVYKPFMGKAVCIANGVTSKPHKTLTVGKIYDFSKNGACGENDKGGRIVSYPRATVDEINESMCGNILFLEIKE